MSTLFTSLSIRYLKASLLVTVVTGKNLSVFRDAELELGVPGPGRFCPENQGRGQKESIAIFNRFLRGHSDSFKQRRLSYLK